jgi:hypothetical protein
MSALGLPLRDPPQRRRPTSILMIHRCTMRIYLSDNFSFHALSPLS